MDFSPIEKFKAFLIKLEAFKIKTAILAVTEDQLIIRPRASAFKSFAFIGSDSNPLFTYIIMAFA